jgi:hypothetical protein
VTGSRLTRDRLARLVAAVTALAVLVGLIFQLHATASTTTGFFASKGERIANVFCFFTILSNLLLGVTNAVLTFTPDRRSPVFSGLRLSGVLSMVVTGVVFHIALSNLHELTGTAAVANDILHTVTPVLAVISWLVVGPRGVVSGRVIWLSIVYPVLWLIATLIRGAFVHYYPYPFLDVVTHGYLRVSINAVIVAVLFLGLAFGASRLDRLIPPRPVVT